MMIDTLLAFIVVRALWQWRGWQAGLFLAHVHRRRSGLLLANSVKIIDGGWFPLVLGFAVFTLLATWKRGRVLLYEKLKQDSMPLDAFISSLAYGGPYRCEGTGIFMTTNPDGVPRAMLHNLLHNKVLHQRVVLLNVDHGGRALRAGDRSGRGARAARRLLPVAGALRLQGRSGHSARHGA